jgi:hypothetical protein
VVPGTLVSNTQVGSFIYVELAIRNFQPLQVGSVHGRLVGLRIRSPLPPCQTSAQEEVKKTPHSSKCKFQSRISMFHFARCLEAGINILTHY